MAYRALSSELGREVAIKENLPAALAVRQDGATVMPLSKGAAEDFTWGRDRLLAEVRTLAGLHRVPGIALVHDFLEASGMAYLVTELPAGQTLHEQVERQGPLDAARNDAIPCARLDGRAVPDRRGRPQGRRSRGGGSSPPAVPPSAHSGRAHRPGLNGRDFTVPMQSRQIGMIRGLDPCAPLPPTKQR
jgi:hypothetical protein